MSSIQGAAFLGIIALGAGAYGLSEADLYLNYTETTATVTQVKEDCYIESSKRKVVKKGTSELAYMDCDIAPLIAKRYGHTESAIHRRAHVTYEYVSPVDGSTRTGKLLKDSNNHGFELGKEFQIYAHNEKPGASRSGNMVELIDGPSNEDS